MSRESCLICTRKHIAQAIICLDEVCAGYNSHAWLAIGHLSEAEVESCDKYPEVFKIIRKYKKRLEKAIVTGQPLPKLLPIIELIMRYYDKQRVVNTNSEIVINIKGEEKRVWAEVKHGVWEKVNKLNPEYNKKGNFIPNDKMKGAQ